MVVDGARALGVLGAILTLATMGCGDPMVAPQSQVAPTEASAGTEMLTDPWLNSLLWAHDSQLMSGLRSRVGTSDFGHYIDRHLADRRGLSPDEELYLTVLDLSLTATVAPPEATEESR